MLEKNVARVEVVKICLKQVGQTTNRLCDKVTTSVI